MMRVELFMILLAGFAGGLVGTLWSGIVTGPVLAQAPQLRPAGWAPESASRLLAGALLYGIGGAVAGFLFWLSWGLTALVATPWPLVGLLYGALLWSIAVLPAVGVGGLRLRQPRALLALLALEYLVATAAVGLFCAYAWHRSA
jgi:hypothetical protein